MLVSRRGEVEAASKGYTTKPAFVVAALAALANEEAPIPAATFALGVLASEAGVHHSFELAQHEQDKEYSRTTP
jgi:hypothetical protein